MSETREVHMVEFESLRKLIDVYLTPAIKQEVYKAIKQHMEDEHDPKEISTQAVHVIIKRK
jgi:predicted DNA-binding protein (UPF0278 family)